MNKKIEKGLSTRQHIVSVATELFTSMGFEATSIEAILTACDVSRGALYHHFASKDELFEAAFEKVEEDIAKETVAATRGITDPVAAISVGCKLFLDMARTDRVRQMVLIDAPSVLGWRKWREIEERHGFGLLKASLRESAKVRGLKEPSEVFAHMLLAALIEAALLIARADDPVAAMASSKAAIDRLIEGMLA